MMAAEKQYRYQDEYRRYGYEYKRTVQPLKEEKKKSKKNTATFQAKDKGKILALLFLSGVLAIALIIITAYSAKIQYNTNNVLAQCDKLEGEIQNLNVDIKTSVNIQAVEDRAIKELGMVYPQFENMTYLAADNQEKDMEDFTLALKENAYGRHNQ